MTGAAPALNASAIFPVDELQLNAGASGSAGYLGIETNGAAFGGRGLSDDVMGTDLGAAYGTVLGTDGHENACLAADNVGSSGAASAVSSGTIATADGISSSFPYVGKPH